MERKIKKDIRDAILHNSELWVKEVHKMIERQLGKDWKEEYVVWDCESHMKEFTKDYKFQELYSSTRNSDHIVLSRKRNKDSECFQFDFLNDSISKIDEFCPGLQNAIAHNKPIVFLVNPFNYNATIDDLFNSNMNNAMNIGGMGLSKLKVYTQFIYRIKMIKSVYDLSNAHIFVFGFADYISSSALRPFRQNICYDFSFKKAFAIPGNQLKLQPTEQALVFMHLDGQSSGVKSNLLVTPKKIIDNQVVDMPEVVMYNLDKEISAYEWIQTETKGEEADLPQMTLSLKLKDSGQLGCANQMASVCFGKETIFSNKLYVFALPTTTLRINRVPLLEDNWELVIPLYAARRCVDRDWLNWHLEYSMPNMMHKNWNQYVADSIVYFMFDNRNKISSMEVDYNDRKYSLRNHLFFMDPSDLLPAFEGSGFNDFFKDYVESDTPYFLKQLESLPLSPIAGQLLDKAKNMTINSAQLRFEMHKKHPNMNLHRWDAGYNQLKKVWKKNDKRTYQEFKELFVKFRVHMKQRTYQIGFLRSVL